MTKDERYLQNEEIKDIVYDINTNRINIYSPCTLYINCTKIKEFPQKKEMIKKYKSVVSIAKSCNCKISYKARIKHTIMEEYESALFEIKNANMNFDKLFELAKEIEDRKIHYCTVDDYKLSELHKVKFLFQKIFIQSSYSKLLEIDRRLDKLIEEFKNNRTQWSSITL